MMHTVIDVAGVVFVAEIVTVIALLGATYVLTRWRGARRPPSPEFLEVECYGGPADGRRIKLRRGQYWWELHQPVLDTFNDGSPVHVTMHDEDEYRVSFGNGPQFGALVHRYELFVSAEHGLRLEYVRHGDA